MLLSFCVPFATVFLFVHIFQVAVLLCATLTMASVFVRPFQLVVVLCTHFMMVSVFVHAFELMVVFARTVCDGFCFCARILVGCRFCGRLLRRVFFVRAFEMVSFLCTPFTMASVFVRIL